ncbi:hypothetical protein C8J57DRAFT_1478046 [Mycena rebaudengoi]|nr:hypothetical protein C8J57DRAFT_1478046 [Mycena rebaudengoi]
MSLLFLSWSSPWPSHPRSASVWKYEVLPGAATALYPKCIEAQQVKPNIIGHNNLQPKMFHKPGRRMKLLRPPLIGRFPITKSGNIWHDLVIDTKLCATQERDFRLCQAESSKLASVPSKRKLGTGKITLDGDNKLITSLARASTAMLVAPSLFPSPPVSTTPPLLRAGPSHQVSHCPASYYFKLSQELTLKHCQVRPSSRFSKTSLQDLVKTQSRLPYRKLQAASSKSKPMVNYSLPLNTDIYFKRGAAKFAPSPRHLPHSDTKLAVKSSAGAICTANLHFPPQPISIPLPARAAKSSTRFLDLAALLPELKNFRRPSKSASVASSIAHVRAACCYRFLVAQRLRTLNA